MKKIEIESLSELPKVAEAVLGELRGRSVVLFRGPMGVGKTTLISRIAAALGAEDTVTSPTFALVNQYEGEGGRRIYHFDFYRINNVEEALDLGYDRLIGRSGHDLYEYRRRILRLLKLSSCGGVWSCDMLSARAQKSLFGVVRIFCAIVGGISLCRCGRHVGATLSTICRCELFVIFLTLIFRLSRAVNAVRRP